METVDVIIPTYRPTKRLFRILERLHAQTYPIQRIILINTEESYMEQLIYGTSVEQAFDLDRLFENVELRHIRKEEFDHGGPRRFGVGLSDADLFVCMTDDAVPADT
ncbi:MAG: glycosyltransferase family 2 protein, partial [Lachnospiraceae bacterium]|nr:glycosyltransferase family 2 protein [Lachnospiraceae bacterium]